MVRNVAIMIFDDVEVLDFCGPFEVFGVSRDPEHNNSLFNVFTVAEEHRPITAHSGLSVNPDYTLANCPKPDLFLVPGGWGVRAAIERPAPLKWVKEQAQHAELALSVCTGAFMLGKAGLLEGMAATTFHTAFTRLQELAPTAKLCPGDRWVDNGKIITSAGISAGIDMSLHVVARLHGIEQARHTAEHMEYRWDEWGETS